MHKQPIYLLAMTFLFLLSPCSLTIDSTGPALAEGFALASARNARPSALIEKSISQAAEDHGLDPALLKAVIHVESRFNPRAVGPRGAKGLMQLMPVALKHFGVTDPFDPGQNVDGGAQFLKILLASFSNDMRAALAAYNAGPTAVRRHNGQPPSRSTRLYVKRVLEHYAQYKSVAS